jgi:hypothetical protein
MPGSALPRSELRPVRHRDRGVLAPQATSQSPDLTGIKAGSTETVLRSQWPWHHDAALKGALLYSPRTWTQAPATKSARGSEPVDDTIRGCQPFVAANTTYRNLE